jgi:hypothetical protein
VSPDPRDILLGIRAKHGRLTPTLVVDEARDETHPLHARFEWDDGVAGEAYRRVQARELIRTCRVVYKPANDRDEAQSVRAFHAVRAEDSSRSYEPVEEIVKSEFLTQLALREMERRWLELQRQYGHLSEFWQLVNGAESDVG